MEQQIRREVTDFHPDHIFDCGQAFRWERQQDGSYTGIAGKKVANIQLVSDPSHHCRGQLIVSNASEEEFETFWKDYLDLNRDYGAIKEELSRRDPVIKEAIGWGSGIRLLQQDPWETLVSFIVSQNNHIPRIKKCIESLCENFGEKAGEYQGKNYYSFPAPEILAAMEPEELSVCRLGYRAKYLTGTARQVEKDGIGALKQAADPAVSYEEAYEYVTKFCGVGPKVANCILLFSMGKYDSFPLDVWMKRVMEQLYGQKSPKEMKAFAEKTFGGYGGFAQQYLFYYIREKEKA